MVILKIQEQDECGRGQVESFGGAAGKKRKGRIGWRGALLSRSCPPPPVPHVLDNVSPEASVVIGVDDDRASRQDDPCAVAGLHGCAALGGVVCGQHGHAHAAPQQALDGDVGCGREGGNKKVGRRVGKKNASFLPLSHASRRHRFYFLAPGPPSGVLSRRCDPASSTTPRQGESSGVAMDKQRD